LRPSRSSTPKKPPSPLRTDGERKEEACSQV
jgi:hypothetical protein